VTSFDLLVLLVVGSSIAFAVIRGALREIGTLLALGAASAAAAVCARPVAALVGGDAPSLVAMSGVGLIIGIVLFAAFYGALHLALQKFALSARGAQVDRVLGGLFGFARGFVLIGLGFLAYAYYLAEERRPAAVSDALTLPFAESAAAFFEKLAPASTRLDRAPEAKETESARADIDGYARGERTALTEMVATLTTSDDATTAGPESNISATPALTEGEPQ
jgi:membrane protein required for colicin V production